MSLTKLLKAPIKLFRKEVITFFIIRRYDLGISNDKLQYIAVKSAASVSVLRQKVWHLLNLPDYCDEVIILKSPRDVEIPLTELRKGNDPHLPYVLEVWLPGKQGESSATLPNMLMGKDATNSNMSTVYTEKMERPEKCCYCDRCETTLSNETLLLNKLKIPQYNNNNINKELHNAELSRRVSTSSIFGLNRRKSGDNFVNLLLKIQSELSNLTNKLAVLEDKMSA